MYPIHISNVVCMCTGATWPAWLLAKALHYGTSYHDLGVLHITAGGCGVQVEGSCHRLCQSLGGEVHRLALQVQVLEESDTHAIEAEAVRQLLPASGCTFPVHFIVTILHLHHVIVGVLLGCLQPLMSQERHLRGDKLMSSFVLTCLCWLHRMSVESN